MYKKLFLLTVCLMLVACQAAVESEFAGVAKSPAELTTNVPGTTANPVAADPLTSEITETSVLGTVTATSPGLLTVAVQTITAPEEEILHALICSPLAATPLETLAEIVSDPYNPPPPGRDERHQGVDFAYYQRFGRDSIAGETVQALLPGIVAFAQGNRLPYGNVMIIETLPEALPEEIKVQFGLQSGEALYQLYAHLQDLPLLEQGQAVTCGQALGLVGQTGYNIPVPHLHLELRIGPAGMRFAGMAFYDTRATPAEMDAYQQWRMSGEFRHLDPMLLIQAYLALE
ncbi:MAG: M23 family metallopeptidase [Anaerolineales bacterium]|nr:M23 family metallopeptidase [Anaerolineales bacterium]